MIKTHEKYPIQILAVARHQLSGTGGDAADANVDATAAGATSAYPGLVRVPETVDGKGKQMFETSR